MTVVEQKADGYITSLFKINDIYSHYDFGGEEKDLSDEINYYYTKKTYSDDEIQSLQNKCIDEWKLILIKICETLIKNVESNKEYQKILKVELKQVKKIHIDLIHGKKLPDEYEKIFYEKLDELKDKVEVKIDDKNFDKKLFNKSLFYGGLIGLASGFFTGYALFKFGFA